MEWRGPAVEPFQKLGDFGQALGWAIEVILFQAD